MPQRARGTRGATRRLARAKNWIRERSVPNKIEQFYSVFESGMTVLDVGVNAEKRGPIPFRNQFLKSYRYASDTYTGLGIDNLETIRAAHPRMRLVEYPGGVFPFADNEFDCVFCNSVVEHVGDEAAHLLFVNEMIRVAKRWVFLTTSSQFFPVEAHTNLVFLHWSPALLLWWRKRRYPEATRDQLRLYSFKQLNRLMRFSTAATRYQIRKNRVLGMTMTFSVLARASDP
jgi:hypothetical protein